jgi:type IV pilus assembly protein PilM
LSSATTSLSSQFFTFGPVRRFEHWLTAVPHPPLVVEIGAAHVSAARWNLNRGSLEAFASESLPFGAVAPSPVDANISQPEEVRSALRRALDGASARGADLALLVPDAVVRVFILPFETLSRRADEALPLLRWRLKKSVPFDVEETVVSWMRQSGRDAGLEVVAAVARQRIVREYEEIVAAQGIHPAFVLSSTLATLPLLEERGATLLVRLSSKTLTTVIVQGANLCVYRSTEMPGDTALLEPQAVLDEIFPAIAYYQDTWEGMIDRVRLSGLGAREELFRRALAEELKCPVASLGDSEGATTLASDAKGLIHKNLDGLVGWMMNTGA